jgi:putative ABC transport system permease protein
LGASDADILRLVIRGGLLLAVSGIAIGIAGALTLTRIMSTLLYETSAVDPATYLLCAMIFVLVALLASYFPARRATRIDPAEALRAE